MSEPTVVVGEIIKMGPPTKPCRHCGYQCAGKG